MSSKQWQLTLRLISLAAFILAIFWFASDRTFEPALAVLGGLGTLIGSFFVSEPEQKGKITAKEIKSGGNAAIHGQRGSDVSAEKVTAKGDVTIGHAPDHDPKV